MLLLANTILNGLAKHLRTPAYHILTMSCLVHGTQAANLRVEVEKNSRGHNMTVLLPLGKLVLARTTQSGLPKSVHQMMRVTAHRYLESRVFPRRISQLLLANMGFHHYPSTHMLVSSALRTVPGYH
jgi:hypothetical protein